MTTGLPADRPVIRELAADARRPRRDHRDTRPYSEPLLKLGAQLFRRHTPADGTQTALASSEMRRKLYEEGKYVPTEYGVILKRGDILGWAARWRREQTAAG